MSAALGAEAELATLLPSEGSSGWLLTLRTDGSGADPDRHPDARQGSVQAFFRGYLFDRAALTRSYRRALVPGSPTDAELALAAYVTDGEVALSRLRGAFALVLVDRERRRTLVLRDPIGAHPLFYARDGERVHVAVSARALAAHLSAGPNRAALADYLCHRWLVADETCYDGVRRVPGGGMLTIAGGRCDVSRIWDPLPEGQPIAWLSDDEVREFPDVFERAVARCLALGSPGIFLSGGLDSVSVAAAAADLRRRDGGTPPHALSLVFPTEETNEAREQEAVAGVLDLPQTLLPFDDAVGRPGLLPRAIGLNAQLSSPLINRWQPAYAALAGVGRDAGVEVILSGSGGDEWLSVTPLFGADLLRAGRLVAFASFLGSWRRSFQHSSLLLVRNALWRFGARPIAGMALHAVAPDAWAARRARRTLTADPAWIAPDRRLRDQQAARLHQHQPRPDAADGFYLPELRGGLRHPLVAMEREELFEFSRTARVRFASPFWDADLVDFLARTPPWKLNAGGRSKGLVRDAVSSRFPELGFDRQKKRAATNFSRQLLVTGCRELAAELGPPEALAALGVVDLEAAQAFVRDVLEAGDREMYRVWDLLNLESWVRLQQN